MPIYEYQCAGCGERIEILQRLNDPAPAACAECGGQMHRQVSAPAFQFKGTGWYVTDYAGRKPSEDAGAEPAATSDKPAKTESKSKESKTVKAAPASSSSDD